MSEAFREIVTLESPTGARLALRHRPAEGAARAVLLIAHGMAEHGARYERFAGAMAGHGLAVYAHDHRGHGKTTAADAPLGRFAARDGWREVIEDVMAVRAHASARHPGLPIVLFGHSMGGLIAWNTMISHPRAFRAVAVWNANFDGGAAGRAAQAILAVEQAFKGSDVPSTMLSRLTFEAWGRTVKDRETLFDWLSHDRGIVRAYIDDPLCGFDCSVSMWRDVFAFVYRGGDSKNWAGMDRALPIHLVGGAEDPGTRGGAAVRRLGRDLEKAGFRDVECTVLEGFRHETLNEIGADRPIAGLMKWIDRVATQ